MAWPFFYVKRGRCKKTLAVFDRALEYFPDDCQLHFNGAVALEELGRADDALNGYGKCLAIEPDYADANYNLARLKELRGDKQGALRAGHRTRKKSVLLSWLRSSSLADTRF